MKKYSLSKFFTLRSKINVEIEYPVIDNTNFGAKNASDISSHLAQLYFLAHLLKPRNIVELGTRDGESTRALRKAAVELGIRGISVDLNSAPNETFKNHDSWNHVQEDDITFAAKLLNKEYCHKILGSESIDFLFIDTSHEYLHTKRELQSYWPLLSKRSALILHDTNLSVEKKFDVDGRLYSGWNNSRGVTKAVEEFFDIKINEKTVFSKLMGDCVFFHVPWSNGMMIVLKL